MKLKKSVFHIKLYILLYSDFTVRYTKSTVRYNVTTVR